MLNKKKPKMSLTNIKCAFMVTAIASVLIIGTGFSSNQSFGLDYNGIGSLDMFNGLTQSAECAGIGNDCSEDNRVTNNNDNPGTEVPLCSNGYTYNDATEKCERPACADGFEFNAASQQCERFTTTQATCPAGIPATGPTCQITGQEVPATCPAGTTGPDTTGRCTGTEIGTVHCANPTSTGVCQTNPRF